MINFKIANIDSGLITIEKPSGKSLSLQLGETVKADVVEVLPSGEVTLKIKGGYVTAKTEVQLMKDTSAFFKVTGTPISGGELKLQFLGQAGQPGQAGETAPLKGFMATAQGEALNKLIQELSVALSKNPGDINPKNIEDILKALPSDINSLPKDVKLQLQGLLQASLKSTGQSIQARLEGLLSQQSPEALKDLPLVKSLARDLSVSIEKLLQTPMKNILQDTGVALEAKFRAIAELLQKMDGNAGALNQAQAGGVTGQADTLGDLIQAAALSPELLQETENNTGNLTQPKAAGSEAAADQKSAALKQPQDMAKPAQDMIRPEDKSIPNSNQLNKDAAEAVNKDLKAGLLKLKELLSEKGGEAIRDQSVQGLTASQRESAVKVVDGLLKDIETFQLLSKTTDSFYTFLPVQWDNLKDGEIAFKRGARDAKGASYSCRMNLDLEDQGKLTITVLMYNKDFFVSFRADNPDLQTSIGSSVKELQESFWNKGLNLKGVNMLETDDNPYEQMEKLEGSDRIISVKA